MSDDDPTEDPFESFEGYDDREGDPFAHLDAPAEDPDPDPGSDSSRPAGPGGGGPPRDGESDPATGPGPGPPGTAGPGSGEPGAAGLGPGEPGAAGRSGRQTGTPQDRDPFEYVDEQSDTGDDDRRDAGRGDPFEAGVGAFEQVDVDRADPDEVWERFTGGAGTDAEPASPAEEVEDEVVEVPKHSFCEGCEYFSPPPEIHCNHEGTSILEFVDMGTVRVANCPVVAERRELGGFDVE